MRQLTLFAAWIIALASLLITLFASEIMQTPVCYLCWYQRVCMYPLVIILGIAAFQNDRRGAIYAWPFTIIGACFALYQYLEQMIPGFAPINLCSANGPSCSEINFILFGFITYPFLSLTGFVAIFVLCMLTLRSSQ